MRLTYPPQLPISERRDEIVAMLREHQCLILIGETGSGKTTQLPKMCLEAGCGVRGLIGCTQPRRIAALSVAERVAEETGAPEAVGCKIRFHDQTSTSTRIKFMTDGVLLAETRTDRRLSRYEALIIDEAHERSLNIDFLLGLLKRLLPERPDLKLVISSATIDAERFSAHFGDAPVISVAGRGFPISTEYWPPDDEDESSPAEQAASAVERLCGRPSAGEQAGDILVFLPTERDIMDCVDSLKPLADSHLILPLFGRLPAQAQRAVFRPSKKRKIIVATNVAETSITVPGIRVVVDTGLARISRYNPRTGTTSLRVSRISQAACEQRRGRCGRVGPGLCVRLYSEEDFNEREVFTLPEIRRANLASVILQMLDLRLGSPADFPFIDPPPAAAIKDGYRLLEELGAFHTAHSGADVLAKPSAPQTGSRFRLSREGRLMARLPLDPRVSRIILEARRQQALREGVILAAALSIQEPRLRPPDQEAKAEAAQAPFRNRQSDFLGLLAIWNALMPDDARPTNSRFSRFCKEHFLSWQRMREWLDVREQILRLLPDDMSAELNDAAHPAPYDNIHKALAAGFLRGLCQKKEKNNYVAAGGREVVLFPGSGLYNHGPDWAIAAEFVETSQRFARTAAAVQPEWLEALAGPLCKKSWSEPHWERKSGKVMALERVTLFGLTIVAGRKVDYGRLNDKTRAEAQAIFIREALVQGDLGGPHGRGAGGGSFPFLDHNQALRQRLEELEDRLRRRGIVADEEAIAAFYAARLHDVCDRQGLMRLIRDAGSDACLRMSEADLRRSEPTADELYRFPETLRCAGLEIPLRYHFAPGAEDDGVSALIPARNLADLPPQPFEWLAPGLLPEKVLQLCRRLPKQVRRNLVPLPEAAERILDGLNQGEGSLYQELERVIFKLYRLQVRREDWQVATLPPHLKMRFVVLDDAGREVAQGRSLTELRGAQNRTSAAASGQGPRPPALPAPRVITAEDLDAFERVVAVQGGAGKPQFLAYARLALRPDGAVEQGYAESREAAREGLAEAVRALCLQDFAREAATLSKLCKEAIARQSASWLSLGAGLTAAGLRERLFAFLVDAVFALDSRNIPGRAAFDAATKRVGREGLVRLARPLLDQLAQALAKRREAASAIEAWAARAKRARCFDPARQETYRQALERILPADFLNRPDAASPASLKDRARYLEALVIRMDRAEHDPAKDAQKATRLKTEENRLAQGERLLERARLAGDAAGPCLRAWREYARLVEEFRVSVFAPELGVSAPVSEKRLTEKWREVESVCRQVE